MLRPQRPKRITKDTRQAVEEDHPAYTETKREGMLMKERKGIQGNAFEGEQQKE
jgi:hypothetical protein